MMIDILSYWPLLSGVAGLGFFAGGLYHAAKNGKGAITRSVFDEHARRMDESWRSVDARLERIERWIDGHSERG